MSPNQTADYRYAFNTAVAEANRYKRTMRLVKSKAYGREVYDVYFAISDPSKRFGSDAHGEFIEPGTPYMVEPGSTPG